MTALIRQRLATQRLIGDRFATVAEAVGWFGAVQAQDYHAAMWALGQRMTSATEATIEQAIAAREVLRTWPMRGTLHFVTADDARWITQLMAPRILRRGARRHRELGLDAKTLTRSRSCLERALTGGSSLTRPEAYAALERAKISVAGQRGIHILGHLALRGVLCIAAPRGKQQTFALLDEWIPRSRELTGDPALAELARRYVTSHGPATTADFAWWSGLNLTEARHALTLATGIEEAEGHWRAATVTSRRAPGVHLLPMYDEYAVAYRDRSAILATADRARGKNGIFAPIVLIDGRIAGTWGRVTKGTQVTVKLDLWRHVTAPVERALAVAARSYGAFVGRTVTVA
ncbi:MAG: winged helix DNA-binding domain-containing protein [Kofleriaceae bacterium]